MSSAELTTLSMNSEPSEKRGSVVPRLWTPPLRELTPDTSWGFDFNFFCEEVIGEANDPWQEWLSIHVGELMPDGSSRFRTALILVARQNGKTSWANKLILYWMFVDKVAQIIATSTDRMYAKMAWQEVCEMVTNNEYLSAELGPSPIRYTIGEEELRNIHDSSYKFAANNKRAARSLTVDRALVDEIREHNTFDAWGAIDNAMNAVWDAQTIAISNQGDASAVVLDDLRTPALTFIETGVGDPRLGLFEWSAPDGSDPTDIDALAMANPDLGNRIRSHVLLGKGMRAKRSGGEALASFRTESMCMRVHLLDPAIDPDDWDNSGTESPIDLAEHRRKVALCFDVSPDGLHATVIAAAKMDDGKVHIDTVEAWEGRGATKRLREELPDIVRRVKPRALGWFPNGPAAAVAADLADRGHKDWPPRGVAVEEIRGEQTAVCMGLADFVESGDLVHPNDPMLTSHVKSSTKLTRIDGTWVFTRKGTTPVDGTYALAGAVHLARTLKPYIKAVAL